MARRELAPLHAFERAEIPHLMFIVSVCCGTGVWLDHCAYRDWGVGLGGSEFITPSQSGKLPYKHAEHGVDALPMKHDKPARLHAVHP